MNVFAFSGILIVLSSLSMGLFVYIKDPKNLLARLWILYNIAVAWWGFSSFKIGLVKNPIPALFWWRFAHIAVIFVPAILLHFVYVLLQKTERKLIITSYIICLYFSVLNFTGKLIDNVELVFNSFYYDGRPPTLYYIIFVFLWWAEVIYIYIQSVRSLRCSKDLKRGQIKYFILTCISFIAAITCYLPVFNIDVYPFGNLIIPVYTFVIAYAIVRHHLLDINIAIKKGMVYSALVALVTAFYLIFVLAIGKIFQGLAGYQSFLVNLFAIFVIALIFNPLRNKIQRFLDYRFFKGTLESYEIEQDKLRERLFNTEKLAYVGQLASSVVHEIKNPLTVIKTFVEYLPKKIDDPAFREKFLTVIKQETDKINKTVEQLLDLAKPRGFIMKPVEVSELLDNILFALETEFSKRDIAVTTKYSPNQPYLQGDKEYLQQVFLNLLLNSIAAMDKEPPEKRLKLSVKTYPKDNDHFVIELSDTGCGIPAENLNKLFTPFFTTKEDGVGLGLLISSDIIKNHNGSISVDSKIGEGTSFKITLPVVK